MKLKKIFVAGLCILLILATLMSITSIVSISNGLIDDSDKNGTSKDPTSSSGNTGEPEASPGEFLIGGIVYTSTDYNGNLSNYYKLNSGRAIVRNKNGIIYCYVKFVIPSAMKTLACDYYDLDFGNEITEVYRYSYDETNWFLLDEKRYDYSSSTGWNAAKIPKNNSEVVYISFYTVSASDYTLQEALEEFENNITESCKFYICNVVG